MTWPFLPASRVLRRQSPRPHTRCLHVWMVAVVVGITGGMPCLRYAWGATLEVYLTDHRDAITDFRQLEVGIEALRLRPNPGLKFWQHGWQNLQPSVATVDLTRYTGTHAALIFRGEVTAGAYEGLQVKLAGGAGLLKEQESTIPIRSVVEPLQLAFTVAPQGITRIVLDLTVVDMRDHPPRGYELQVKGYAWYANGTLVTKVPPG